MPDPQTTPQHKHKQIPIQIWADVDEGIADFVKWLNTLSGIRTHASCQGTATHGPQVMISWEDEKAFEQIKDYPLSDGGDHWAYIHPKVKL